MCTLSLLLQQSSDHPLIVAANRDEETSRPTQVPHVWDTRPPILAGKDLLAGGTWMGLNESGVFAGLTNLWEGIPPDAALESRGEIVTRLLAAKDLAGARAQAAKLVPGRTNPFILVCADTTGDGFWITTDDDFELHSLEPGIYSFGNRVPGTLGTEKLERAAHDIETAWESSSRRSGDELFGRLAQALGTHHGDCGPAESLCVHTGQGFGTVSAMILMVGGDLARGRFWYAPGSPCTHAFEDLSGLLRELS